MPAIQKTNLLDTIKDIGEDAQNLMAEIKSKAEIDADLTNKERGIIEKLIKRAEDTLNEASQKAKEKRQQRILDLEILIENLMLALATPGLDVNSRKALKRLLRRRRAELLRLQNQEAFDFAGILTVKQVKEIEEVLKKAKEEVALKKKAAAFLGLFMQITDIAFMVVSRASAAI